MATVKETVNPAIQPVGVNLVQDVSLTEGLKIKMRGKRLAICQLIAYSRMYSCQTWADAESGHCCAIGTACTGLIQTPQRIMDGSVSIGAYQETRQAAVAMQQLIPWVKPGVAGV